MGNPTRASDEEYQLHTRPQDGQSQHSTHISSVQIIDDGAGSIPGRLEPRRYASLYESFSGQAMTVPGDSLP